MRLIKVIEALDRRKAKVGSILEAWEGPLQSGTYPFLCQEHAALGYAIEIVKTEHERRHLQVMHDTSTAD